MYNNFFKRLIDFTLSLLAVIFLSPLLLLLMIVGFIAMSGNPFFTQQRPGKNEKIFKLIKFRTMNNKKDKEGNLLPDEVRLTKYGKFLRSTSLDELPELFNILKGDMSIVGPRPLVEGELEEHGGSKLYWKEKPGITGWWGSHGRSDVDYEQRLELEYYYIRNISFKLDVICIFKTITAVLNHEGAV
jgi:lipopolysaccharide/colanic/teichoic acid biosynthesis glycosyltransferase